MTRPPDERRRSERSHTAILRAAHELCNEIGYGAVTIEGIAARAGVGKQTIYRWWPSKGALLLDVFVGSIAAAIDQKDSSDALRDLERRVVTTATALADPRVGPHIAGLIGDAQHDPALAQDLSERLVQPARSLNRERLRQGQRDGQLRGDVPVDTIADLLFAPVWFNLLVLRTPLSPARARTSVRAALRGLASE